MRWIVGSLVVINVIVLIWQLLLPEPAVVNTPPKTANNSQGQANSIQLLSELEEATLQAMMSEKSRMTLAKPESDEPLCTVVGPFPRLLSAEYFVERIHALDTEGEVREMDVPGEPGYWVYLPAEPTQKEALSRLRELQSKGIDSYLIPKGELANGISLGMFSRQELANRRLAAMREMGYPAEISEITRSYKEIWVVLPPGEAGKIAIETWQEMLGAEDGLERRQNFCPPVASPDNIN